MKPLSRAFLILLTLLVAGLVAFSAVLFIRIEDLRRDLVFSNKQLSRSIELTQMLASFGPPCDVYFNDQGLNERLLEIEDRLEQVVRTLDPFDFSFAPVARRPSMPGRCL